LESLALVAVLDRVVVERACQLLMSASSVRASSVGLEAATKCHRLMGTNRTDIIGVLCRFVPVLCRGILANASSSAADSL
jgi:hypothetical protein